VLPAGSHGPGVVVLHARWGLNPDIIVAADGFSVIAPDLLDGRTSRAPEAAGRPVSAADASWKRIADDVKRAEARMREESGGKVGVVASRSGCLMR